jgi:NADH-quinone oxidoreductase subunit K
MVTTASYLVLAAALFALGVVGVLVRRNVLVALMASGLMFNSAILVFAAFGRAHAGGEVIGMLALGGSAAGLGVGAALGALLFRRRQTLDSGELDQLKW